ncbi:hypothetical protein ACFFX0_00620 [Citricoccus parietis]|uniref:Uncharacterized protein n=1 Tax=Citricoccus parietis TaxID=592307 RepID=A0ABV5FU43_9MICC
MTGDGGHQVGFAHPGSPGDAELGGQGLQLCQLQARQAATRLGGGGGCRGWCLGGIARGGRGQFSGFGHEGSFSLVRQDPTGGIPRSVYRLPPEQVAENRDSVPDRTRSGKVQSREPRQAEARWDRTGPRGAWIPTDHGIRTLSGTRSTSARDGLA